MLLLLLLLSLGLGLEDEDDADGVLLLPLFPLGLESLDEELDGLADFVLEDFVLVASFDVLLSSLVFASDLSLVSAVVTLDSCFSTTVSSGLSFSR